jgi:hypothetical protein
MIKAWRWFLAVIVGLSVTLGGLFWDAVIHSQEHGHLVEESLLDPSNPGHVVFGLGLALTACIALAGFTASWLREQSSTTAWRKISAAVVPWIVVGVAGALTLLALARTG